MFTCNKAPACSPWVHCKLNNWSSLLADIVQQVCKVAALMVLEDTPVPWVGNFAAEDMMKMGVCRMGFAEGGWAYLGMTEAVGCKFVCYMVVVWWEDSCSLMADGMGLVFHMSWMHPQGN